MPDLYNPFSKEEALIRFANGIRYQRKKEGSRLVNISIKSNPLKPSVLPILVSSEKKNNFYLENVLMGVIVVAGGIGGYLLYNIFRDYF
jgi:hypothetical protein